ncbi:MAG TPA: hypothetical protein VMV49_10615 [Candidatus Deferrimicrobium sp.]|nr:hypothetical protein [Candidatus Deferrimicrobium sp.]
MYSLDLCITDRCNQDCPHCYVISIAVVVAVAVVGGILIGWRLRRRS